MTRLIDADALDDALAKEYLSASDDSTELTLRGSIIFNLVLDRVRCIAMRQPTIGIEPVRHGRWIAVPSSDVMTGKAYKCSECNKMRYGSFMPNYCQNCGAKMDVGASDA